MTDEERSPPDGLEARLQPRLAVLFRNHGVPPDEAEAIVAAAAAEVRHRVPHPREIEARLLAAIEARCRRYREEQRRKMREALTRGCDPEEDET